MYNRAFPVGNALFFFAGGMMSLLCLPRQARVCAAQRSNESPSGAFKRQNGLAQQDGGASPRQVPIWEKSNLTLEEAAAYSGIGINKLRSLSDKEHCQFVLWVGSKRLIKRRKLDEYTERMYSL